MNLYLDDKTIKTKRETAEELHQRYLECVLAETNETRKKPLQKLYADVFHQTYNANNGCFRMNDSFVVWLVKHIDSNAETSNPFSRAALADLQSGRDSVIDSDAVRREAINTVRRWCQIANGLFDSPSHRSYIKELNELHTFVSLAHETRSPIRVTPDHDFGF